MTRNSTTVKEGVFQAHGLTLSPIGGPLQYHEKPLFSFSHGFPSMSSAGTHSVTAVLMIHLDK